MRRTFILCLLFSLMLPMPGHSVLFSSKKTVEKYRAKIAQLPDVGKEKTKAILYTNLGILLYKKGDFYEATRELNNALRHKTDKKMRRQIYKYLGKSYESSGRLAKAVTAYEQAVYYDRRNWKRHRDLGQLYEIVQLYDKAVGSYEEAIRRNPRSETVDVYFALGRTNRKKGSLKEAEEALRRARGLGYESVNLQKELSLVYEGQGRYRQSLLAYEKGLGTDSTAEEWARYVYLAVLSKNKTFANQGMDKLRSLDISAETLEFYEALVQLSGHPFSVLYEQSKDDVFIQRLFRQIK